MVLNLPRRFVYLFLHINRGNFLKRFFTFLLRTFLVLILLLILAWGLVQTTPVQNWLVGKVTHRLSKDLKTYVSIKNVDFALFNSMLLEGTLVEDLKKRIEANERQIYDLKKGVEEAEKEIGVRKEKIEKRIEWAKRCIESREAVMKIFESAISKAKGETGDDIRVMRDELIAVWEPSVKDHNQPVSDIKSGIRKCEEMRDQRE